MNNPRVLFILRDQNLTDPTEDPTDEDGDDTGGYPYTPSSGLATSAGMVSQMLQASGTPSKVVEVPDNNSIHAEYVAFGADVAIIEALWVVPEKFDEIYAADPTARFVVRNHSETPFLATDGIAFDWILKYLTKPNVWVGCNSRTMYEEVKFLATLEGKLTPEQVEQKLVYAPNYYELSPPPTQPRQGFLKKLEAIFSSLAVGAASPVVNIGCFGAIRPLKNHMEQAIGALKFADANGLELRFHVNDGGDPITNPVWKNLTQLFQHYAPKHQLVAHDWVDHDSFLALVRQMDVVTQVSFSETFNIVAADAVSQNIATVTSDEVAWSAPCAQADPNSSDDIAAKIERMYKMKQRFPCYNPSLKGLKASNVDCQQQWDKFLTEMQ